MKIRNKQNALSSGAKIIGNFFFGSALKIIKNSLLRSVFLMIFSPTSNSRLFLHAYLLTFNLDKHRDLSKSARKFMMLLNWHTTNTPMILMKPILLSFIFLCTFFTALHGATFTVSNTNNSGSGSLRQAIDDANNTAGADVIVFSNTLANQTITVISPFLVITSDMTIDGSGAANLTISGGNASRIFWIQNGTITIQNLTLANGYAKGGNGSGGGMGAGGAIFMHEVRQDPSNNNNLLSGSIDLRLVNVILKNNKAIGGSGSDACIGGGGLGGNGGGGGGGVLGNGDVAGGSVTSASGLTPGMNGGIAIFGNGGVYGGGVFGSGADIPGFGGGGGATGDVGGFGSFGGGGAVTALRGYGYGGYGGGGGCGEGAGGYGGGGGGGGFGGSGGFGGGNGSASGGGGGAGFGGAIFVTSGKLTLQGVTFDGNTATGGTGANNGVGFGGALFIASGATNGCGVTFINNSAADDPNSATNNDNVYGTIVNCPTTNTSITSNLNPSFTGNNVTFTATVTSNSIAVTEGTVTFKEGATNLAANVAVNGSGQASFNTNALSEGMHLITAVYNGTVNYATSTGTLNQEVLAACPTITSLTSDAVDPVCASKGISVTASGLSNMGTTYGIAFKSFSAPTSDPYTGGTTLAGIINSNLTGGSTSTPSTNIGTLPTGDNYVYAILSPTPTDVNCRPSASLKITVKPDLTPSVVLNASPSTTICAGTPVTFTATPTNEGTTPTYKWFLNNNEIIGQTGVTYTNNSIANGDNVQVQLTSNAACASPTMVLSNTIAMTVTSQLTWYLDKDGDGYYLSTVTACTSPGSGYKSSGTALGDCNDSDNTKWQSASLYIDADGDGYTNGTATVCYGATIPTGYKATSLGTDCNDSDNTKWQSASLYIDADNDGYTNGTATVCYGATIPTGYKATSLGSDCNDANSAINPAATEICGNNIDDNCNGLIDENCNVCQNATAFSTTNITTNSAKLRWTAATNPVEWQVEYKTTNNGSKWINKTVSAGERSLVITGLSKNQNYIWHIRAKCGKVWTAYSSSIAFKTLASNSNLIANGINTKAIDVKAYPNPAQDVIVLQMNNLTEGVVEFQIMDISGRIVKSFNTNMLNGFNELNIDIQNLTSGLHFIKIKDSMNQIAVIKFSKM